MYDNHDVEGFDECVKLIETLEKKKKKILLYFSGSADDKGESWCPDCVKADPIVKGVIKENQDKNFAFIHVGVGTREQWKNPECKFRTDKRFKLTSVPTLMLYQTEKRLNDVECQDQENVKMLLEDV